MRVAVPDQEAAQALISLCRGTTVPLVADIHFDYRLALTAIKAGVAGLRLNPGNIGGPDRVREVALAAKERQIPLRIGVNAGSLEQGLLKRHGGISAAGMVESALKQAELMEDIGHTAIVLSLKASDVLLTVDAYGYSRQVIIRYMWNYRGRYSLARTIRSAVSMGRCTKVLRYTGCR